MEQERAEQPLIVRVPDSPDTRLFIELSSYASDLTEASNALEMALEANDEGSHLRDATPFLIGFAVVAYWRCFGLSKVRKPLTQHLEIPAEHLQTHDLVRVFRNATIAHSQSDLAVTYPLGVLDPRTLDVKYVSGATLINPLPLSVARAFGALVEAVHQLLDEAIEQIRARLESRLREADRNQLLADSTPVAAHKMATEFNPGARRMKYPAAHTLYWESADEA